MSSRRSAGLIGIVLMILTIGLGGAWIFLRIKGLSDPISPVRSPFFERFGTEKFLLVAYGGATHSHLPNTIAAFEDASRLNERVVLWVDTVMSADNIMVATHEKSFARQDGNPTLVSLSNYADFPKLANGEAPPQLADVLTHFPKQRFIINVRDYRPGMDHTLADTVDHASATDRVLVQSDQDGVLRDMRNLRPQWLYGVSQAQITQLLMLVPFGLASVAPVKADVYITDLHKGTSALLNEDVVAEMHRRSRKIIVGPIESTTQAEELRSRGADGIITPNPEAYLGFL